MQLDLRLDDILNRSLRLESPMNFRIPLDLENIKQLSSKILPSLKTDESGLTLLAKESRSIDIDILKKSFDDLSKVNLSKMIQNEKLTFSEECAEAMKTSTAESVEKSSKKDDISSDYFIFSNLARQMKEKETLLHRLICHAEPAAISRFGTIQSEDEQMELSSLSGFYNYNLFSTDFVHLIDRTIRNELSQEVRNALADTYSIIGCISQEKSPLLGSLRYLTQLFRRIITNEVNKNRINGNRGGAIGLIPTIKAYVILKNYPFGYSQWAVLYFSLLCGVQRELLDFLDTNSEIFSDCIKPALENYFQHLPLPKSIANSLEAYHDRDITMKKIDPFKTIVLAILTRKHNIPDSEQIIESTEEWLWIRLQFIHVDSLNGQSSADLSELAEELKDFDPKDRPSPFLRGQVYLLTNLYQKAAEWFLSCENYVNHCLHIVISMNMANLIDDHILVRPLLIYAKDIFRADPTAAIRYLSLLHERELRIDTIATFVVETKKGEKIFYSQNDSIPVISSVLPPDEQHEIIQKAAHLAEYRDMHSKAANIYSLIGQFDEVIDLECIQLRKYIEGFLDDNVYNECQRIYEQILSNNSPESNDKFQIFRVLLQFALASHHARANEYREATDLIEKADFLPTTNEQVQPFRIMLMASSELRKALPTMIIIAIKSYAELYGNAKNEKKEYDKKKADAILELTSDIDIPNYAQKELLDDSLRFQ